MIGTARFRRFSLLTAVFLFCAACGAGAPHFFTLIATSPETASRQGYTTDGAYHYTSDTAAIYKRNDDEQWTVAAENRYPFSGLSGRPNHLGDLDYHDGKLYVAVERFERACKFENQQIAVYDASDLSLLHSADTSAQGSDVSGVAAVPERNLLYLSSFCDGSKLWKHDLSTLAFVGTLSLDKNIPALQGITWDGERFYASSSDGNRVYVIYPDGRVRGPVIAGEGCEAEGLKWHDGMLRWSMNYRKPGRDCRDTNDNYVHTYEPLRPPPG
jgi:hypothetical protein